MCKSLSSNFAFLQGKAERDACYKPIIEEIQRIFPGTEWLGNYTFLYVVSSLKVSISMKETFLICLYQQIHKYRMCKISHTCKSRGRKIPMCNLIITKITTAATMMIVMMMIMMMMLITERSKRITILMIILIALINIKDFFQVQNG